MIALSSAYKEALIGIEIDGKKAFKSMDANCKHSENLLLNIDKSLNEIGKTIQENDTYSVVVGPGSFTGLRIGIALVKGLLAGSKDEKKIISLTTFDLMAYSYITNNDAAEDFYCVINALSGLFYVCKYDKNGKKLEDERMIDGETLPSLQGVKVSLSEENVTEITVHPTCEELLSLSKLKAEKGEFIKESELLPLYLRKSQAEMNLKD